VFHDLYGFNTEEWLIPSTASQISLTSKTCRFLQEHDTEGNLFIVYYGGHGSINNARQNEWWCKRSPGSASVDWSAIQTLFGTAVSDVLVLLDCCAAASSTPGAGSGTMEAIAACGWESQAPPPGEFSFTNTLIEVLEDWVDKPAFSAAMLHTEILFILKQKGPDRGRYGEKLEGCTTPVHWVHTKNSKTLGIEISCLVRPNATGKAPTPEASESPRCTSYVDFMDLDDDVSPQNLLHNCHPTGNYEIPHVLISIALDEDQGALDAISCRRWLADFPALAKYAKIEGIYKSYSTLVTMSVPVMIWDHLPSHPACSFIGFVLSPNKIRSTTIFGQQSADMLKQRMEYSLLKNRRASGWKRSKDSSYGSDVDSEVEAGTREGDDDSGSDDENEHGDFPAVSSSISASWESWRIIDLENSPLYPSSNVSNHKKSESLLTFALQQDSHRVTEPLFISEDSSPVLPNSSSGSESSSKGHIGTAQTGRTHLTQTTISPLPTGKILPNEDYRLPIPIHLRREKDHSDLRKRYHFHGSNQEPSEQVEHQRDFEEFEVDFTSSF
jgi:hypothetical protein